MRARPPGGASCCVLVVCALCFNCERCEVYTGSVQGRYSVCKICLEIDDFDDLVPAENALRTGSVENAFITIIFYYYDLKF